LACTPCNIDPGNRDIKEFLKRKPKRLKKIQTQSKAPLKDAAAVNATRLVCLLLSQVVGELNLIVSS